MLRVGESRSGVDAAPIIQKALGFFSKELEIRTGG
jgi:hypothetical protein